MRTHRCRSLRAAGRRLGEDGGFTLVELSVVMLMVGFGFTAAFAFYSTTLARTADTEARINTLADARTATEVIARDVRDSASVCAPLPSPSANFLALSGAPDLDSVSSPSSCEASRMIVYDCATTPGSCSRSEAGAAPVLVVDGLDTGAPVFAQTTPNYVRIDLRITPPGRDRAIAFERGATLRNFCEGGC